MMFSLRGEVILERPEVILERPMDVVRIALLLLVYFIIMFSVSFAISYLMKFPYADTPTCRYRNDFVYCCREQF